MNQIEILELKSTAEMKKSLGEFKSRFEPAAEINSKSKSRTTESFQSEKRSKEKEWRKVSTA